MLHRLLKDVIRRLRNKLNEPAYPTDSHHRLLYIHQYRPAVLFRHLPHHDMINDGLRDIARRAEDLITYDQSHLSVPLLIPSGHPTPVYPMPPDIIRLFHRIREFVPSNRSTYQYPLSNPRTAL